MKRGRKTLVLVLVLAVCAYGVFRAYRAVQERRKPAGTDEKSQGPLRVVVQRVETGTLTNSVCVTGGVEPLAEVDVVPKVTGTLQGMRLPTGELIEEGTLVQKGQLVAVIEHSALAAALQQAKAAVAVTEASCERSKVNLADYRREKIRWEGLYKEGSTTERQRDQAVTAYERSLAELRLDQARIAQAGAAFQQAKVNLDEATIEAPLSGVVSQKYVDEGAFVGPTTPLFKIIKIDVVEISGGVAGRYYPRLNPGKTKAEVEVDAYPGEKFTGRLSRVRPELDKVTRTAIVTIRVPNPQQRLKPGMYARIRVVVQEKKNVTVVSDKALQTWGKEHLAFVVNDGKIQARKVKIGLEDENRNEVLAGLSPGDVVVVRGRHLLKAGMAVQTEMEGSAE